MLSNKERTKEQLVSELALLRQRVAELESVEAERRKAEIPLLASEEYQRLFELSPMGITVLDMKGVITTCNSAVYMRSGYSKDDFIGKHFSKVSTIRARDIPKFIKMFASLIRGKVPKPLEVMYTRKDGTTGWTEAHISLMKSSGKRIGIQAIQNDITERKQLEETLRLSSTQWQSTFDAISDATCVMNAEGRIQQCNDAMSQLSSKPVSDIMGHTCCEFIHGTPEHIEGCPWVSVQDSKNRERAELLVGDKWFEITVDPILDSNHKLIGAVHVVSDITERKQAEEALRQSEEKLRLMFDSVTDGITVTDLNGVVSDLNDRAAEIHGFGSKDELLGKNSFELIARHDHERATENMRKTLEQGSVRGIEYSLLKADGSEFPGELSASVLKDTAGNSVGFIAITRDITERKQAEEEIAKLAKFPSENPNPVMRVAQNGTILYANQAALPLLNEWRCQIGHLVPDYWHKFISEVLNSGLKRDAEVELGNRLLSLTFAPGVEAGYVNLYGLDITGRKQAEERERKLQQELALASRLAAVGELAAGVAHEINSPLTGVLGFSERLLRKSTDEEISRDLERIHNEAQRMVKVMDNLRTFTRCRQPEKQYSDINDILQMTLELRVYELRTGNIEIVTDLAPGLPEIEVDFHQIQQVFLNIILNAEQVMTEAHSGSKLTVKTGKIRNHVRISFTDDGPGISAEHLVKVFDPFFTTRGEKGGTGLGLSVCHSIVTGHGGRLYARSKAGKGATFFVELPCS